MIFFLFLVILVVVLTVILINNSNQKNPGNPSPQIPDDGIPEVEWISSPHPSGKYGDASPGERLKDLFDEFGPPSVLDPRAGGMAIWYKRDLNHSSTGKCFEEIMIKDEQIPHGLPANHVDFLYTWYYLNVPEDLIDSVRGLSTSVTYDPLKKWVRARCHFMGANVATLYLAKQIAIGEITMKEAKSEYGNKIKKASDNPHAYKEMVQYLCQR